LRVASSGDRDRPSVGGSSRWRGPPLPGRHVTDHQM